MSAFSETASVPLALVIEGQRRLLVAETLPELAEATWNVARQVNERAAVAFYRRAGAEFVLAHAVPPRVGDDATIPVERLASRRGAIVVFAQTGDEVGGAVVIERRGGGGEAALQALAELAAQTLRLQLLREQEREQQRRLLARQLHDGVVQDLAYLGLQLDLLGRGLPPQADEERRLAARLREAVDGAIGRLRGTIGELRRQDGPRAPGDPATGGPDLERAVLAIVREALHNVRKHASASRVDIALVGEESDLHLRVRDNGIGIAHTSETDAVDGEHFGLEQMRELAGELGGSLVVEPAPGGGTRVDVRLPLHSTEWAW